MPLIPVTSRVKENGVDIDKPLYYLRRKSDGFPINPRLFSNTIYPALPNPGDDEEYLPVLTDLVPNNDPAFTTVIMSQGANEVAKTWEIRYRVIERSKEEQLLAVDNAKRLEVQKHFPLQDAWESMIIMVAALARSQKLELTANEQKAIDRVVAVASKLTENLDVVADMKAKVDAGQRPDMSPSVWAAVDPVLEAP